MTEYRKPLSTLNGEEARLATLNLDTTNRGIVHRFPEENRRFAKNVPTFANDDVIPSQVLPPAAIMLPKH